MQEGKFNMEAVPCVNCSVNAGDIFLCGEGLICTECMAKLTGEKEEIFFNENNVTDEVRDEARQRLQEERSSGNQE